MNEKSIFSRLLYVAKMLYHELYYLLCIPIIQGWYGGFWNYRHKIKSNGGSENMYYAYLPSVFRLPQQDSTQGRKA